MKNFQSNFVLWCIFFLFLLAKGQSYPLKQTLDTDTTSTSDGFIVQADSSAADSTVIIREDSLDHADQTYVYSLDWSWLPMGHVSFADSVVLYDPGAPGANTGDEPDLSFQDASCSLGIPDHTAGDKNFTALGTGGTLILKFVDNVFFNGPGPDLYFWMPDDVPEEVHVWISRDNVIYKNAGVVSSRNPYLELSGVAEPGVFYTILKIRDDPFQEEIDIPSRGADIDAVAAIHTAVIRSIQTESLFEPTEMKLKSEAISALHSVADVIREYPDSHVLIEVTTENLGSGDYPLLLSQQWAKMIRDFFIFEEHLSNKQYSAIGLGKHQNSYRDLKTPFSGGMVQIIILPK